MVTRTYPHNDEFNDYLLRSGEQIALGNFSDEVTLLGTGGQVLAGASGVDFLMDARDIGYDVVNWEWSWRHAGKTTIDIVAIVPVVGALKYSDEVSALVKGTVKGAGNAFDAAKSGGKHSGFYKQYIGKSDGEIRKGVQSINKQIADHQNKIRNPEAHIPNFKQLDPRQQEALINKKWPSDIQRQMEQKEILEGILRSR